MGFEVKLEVSLGPFWVKKAMVVSHERSGTHFLMNTLADNFGYVSFPWIDLDVGKPINYYSPDNILGFLKCMKGQPILNILKSHHQVDFFLPILGELLEEYHIFYIHRKVTEVMESFAKHINGIEWDAGPRTKNGKELMFMEPSGGLLRYQKK